MSARGESGRAGFLILKDLATGHDIRRIENLPSQVALVAFSPDDRMLAWTCYNDHAIRLVETASGRERRRLAGHRSRITALAFSADGRRLLSGCEDTTALVWDLGGEQAQQPAAVTNLETLWSDLAAEDAARAYQAIHKIAPSRSSAIPFLRKRLHPVAAVDAKHLDKLISALDSDDFALRQKSTEELQKLGEVALPACRKALEGQPSLKAPPFGGAVGQSATRVVGSVRRTSAFAASDQALELAGTSEARELLETLAAGAKGVRLTAEAKASLARLRNRARK